MDRSAVSVVIPCLDEEAAIGACVAAVRAHGVGEVIVVDGGSADRTAERAAHAGARLVVERRRGYGRAMLANNNLEKAISELETAVKLDPTVASAWFHLARAFEKAGRTADAERALKTYQQLSGKN